jgi:2-polyprenyl-3-methyl-5-hydroxy-6-metoxy-1,4-benzoquinol methylase
VIKIMNHKSLKSAYLEVKTSKESLLPERINLGFREVHTLNLLASEIGYVSNIGSTVLDLGCADKYLAPAIKSIGSNYIGLDYFDVNFETDKLPIESNSVDIAVSLAVIEHISDPDNFLSEIFRCLRPGGLIYLSTPNFQLDFRNFYNDPTHVRPYTPTSLEQLLTLNNFTSSATFPGIRCKDISWYRGPNRFNKAYYFLPFRNDTRFKVPAFLKGHSRSVFGLALKPMDPFKLRKT